MFDASAAAVADRTSPVPSPDPGSPAASLGRSDLVSMAERHGGAEPVAGARARCRARPSDHAARDALVEDHRALAERFAWRFANRGVPYEDLHQTALLALVQAAERFDPDRGSPFVAFAAATISGSIKRYFRDSTWAVRPPRSLQELHLRVRRADEVLGHELGRRPAVAELAEYLGVDQDSILEALEAGMAHGAVSADAPAPGQDDGAPLGSFLGAEDGGYLAAEARTTLWAAVAGLDARNQEIIRLRFVEGLSQQEISGRLGISQSYLSRVLRGVLTELRGRVGELAPTMPSLL